MLDNKNIQKVFSLSDFRKKQLVGDVPQRTRETYREYGYFGGGNYICLVQRIDYSNDTQNSSPRGTFLVRFSEAAAAGNSNYGWHGGRDLSGGSLIQRIDYSNDSQTSLRGRLSLARIGLAASGNLNYGWFGGGNIPGQPLLSQVDRIDYANDLSTSIVRGPLGSGRYSFGATGNSNFGYFGLGSQQTIVERISYSNDSVIALRRGNFIFGRTYATSCATGNSNFGYFAGGLTGGLGYRSSVERVSYSNDTAIASTRGPLSVGRAWTTGSGNLNFGYYAGGGTDIPNIYGDRIVDRIDYSSDTTVLLVRGLLNTGTRDPSATSSASFGGAPNSSFASNFTFPTVPNAGYFGGGSDGTNDLAAIDKVDYANDTATASVRSALSVARNRLVATGNGSFGYFGYGFLPGPNTTYSTVDRLEYSSDTQNTVTRGALSSAGYNSASTGNSNFGYFGGGYTPSLSSKVDRIDYSNDTATASVRGPLSLARRILTATGNRNFGYFGGGWFNISIIDRIDYANDSATALVRGPLSSARYGLAATGNSNFGYFGGGAPGSRSTVDRLDYSNDTNTASVRGPLTLARGGLGATGSQTFGYFGGGGGSTTDRINYSNDTAVASIRGPLSTAKSALAATSPLAYGGAPIYSTNPLPQVLQKQITFNDANTLDLPFKRALGSFGYFGGGSSPGSSVINRIDYSNDLATALVRGSLSSTRYAPSGASNSNFGYYAKGNVSSIERINFSNDSSIGLLRTNASNSLNVSTGFSNNSYGYFCGGQFPASSVVDRIDFSSDNIISTRGNMISPRGEISSSSTQEFGYIYGGREPVSFIQRISTSNDLSLASFRSNLSTVKNSTGATGNKNFGYCGGGRTSSGGSTNISTVERLDYSNDLISPSIRGPLSSARYRLSATGNSNFGYFNGGTGTGSITAVNRIDFSNDTQTTTIRGNLSSSNAAATTNARTS